ncbi:MAG: peptidoglycan bridge formation glycyltransferase FemA/FemB family protein [Chloroflexota bacterium]
MAEAVLTVSRLVSYQKSYYEQIIQMRIFKGSGKEWNELISEFPEAHVLQSWEWGQIKACYSWYPSYYLWQDDKEAVVAAALILERSLSIPLFSSGTRILYVPKGPMLSDWGDVQLRGRVIGDLLAFSQQRKAIFVKIDPDVRLGVGVPGSPESTQDPAGQAVVQQLQNLGGIESEEQIQFRNTFLIDLTKDEEELLAAMKQKTRYNLRLAERRGVTVRVGSISDVDLLYRMYAETSVRDGFVIRHWEYYRQVWGTFIRNGMAEPLIAEVEGEPVGALIIFRMAGKAWFIYGMSRSEHREKMPNHLLQWQAIIRSKAAGCSIYDMWGAPDDFVENDPLWGVYRFKQGFGGEVVRTVGAWDFPNRRLFYRLYTHVLPNILAVMRSRGKARTRQTLAV